MLHRFWAELKRRNVLQVATVYAMTSWLVIQIAVSVFPYLHFPEWVVTAVIILALVGFPIALVIAWIYEYSPSGMVRTAPSSADGEIAAEPKERSNKGWVVIVVLAVLLVAQYFYFNHWKEQAAPTSAIDELAQNIRSVAVLPFVNMSSDIEQEYFSDGLTEDIITQLAKIGELHVISRTTCMKFKGDSLSLKVIGEQLNVGTILEGSVQKSGNQLRITAQLINVATDAHLWAESYDRPLADLFTVQREIATAIAVQLKQKLSPDDVALLAEVPTQNVEAYQAYLKGRHLSHQVHFDGETALRAVDDLQKALEMDSTFALAYAELARCHARVYYLRSDLSAERQLLAKNAADRALALGADQPEVHMAIGDYYSWAFRDKEKAREHWSIASKGMPNNAEVLMASSYPLLLAGRIDDYIAAMKKATELSPKDVNAFSDLSWGYMWAHRFPEGIEAANKAILLAPDQNWPKLYKGINYFEMQGACKEARDAIDLVDHDYAWYFWAMYYIEVAYGNFDAAFKLVDALPDGWDIRKTNTLPASLYRGFLCNMTGDSLEAKKHFKKAIEEIEKELPTHPEDARYHSAMGLALAGAGQKERAVKMGLKAMELTPYSKDAAYGTDPIYDMATIYTLVGDFDKAFEQIEFNLSHPGNFSIVRLQTDKLYDALRSDPRYNQLVQKYSSPEYAIITQAK